MKKELVFTINKGVSKNTGKEYFYLENKDLSKRVYLSEQEIKILMLLKLI